MRRMKAPYHPDRERDSRDMDGREQTALVPGYVRKKSE